MNKPEQTQFIESRIFRDMYITKLYVLDKIKILSLLPDDEHMTSSQVADYYETKDMTIRQLVIRHREELLGDGLKILRGSDLKEFKKKIELHNVTLTAKSNLTLFNRRCCLRIGMLLRDSEVAKQVRTYLLNIEEQANQEQKSSATKGSGWEGKDIILYDLIVTTMNSGGTFTDACKIASVKLSKSVNACKTRYSRHLKHIIQNEDLKNKIRHPEENRKPKNNSIDEINLLKKLIDDLRNDSNDLLKKRLEFLEFEVEQLKQERKRLQTKNRKLSEELSSFKAVVRAAMNVKLSDEIKSFKMDKNGNLERVLKNKI
ncbi:hypothetical protein [Paenibacillus dendritiformis]|uniref:hypothetical protein n=1 Tax=Paenibacillus dendritiformis TaxID=130049 RepID=UPI00387E1F4B